MALLKVLPVSEGGRSVCSDETLNRLQKEARELFNSMSEEPPSVGDAIFVEYDHAFCEKHKIGRFGRKTVKDGEILFHAGPKQVVHPSVYVMDDHNFLDYIRQWRDGGYCPVPVDKLLQGPKLPELIEPKRPKMNSLSYEQGLFKWIASYYQKPITLVNPSFSTMTALKSSIGGYVTLTATGDHAWERDIFDFVSNSRGKLQLLSNRTVRGIAYLGTDVPQWYPEQEWFRLTLSPFVVLNKEFKNFKVDFAQDGVMTRYEKKKGYVVSSVLERDCPEYVTNPVTVDTIVGRKDQWYFCQSSFPLGVDHLDDVKVSHAPWFVNFPKLLEWEKCRAMGQEAYVKHQGGIVYDIKGEGTWLSRRARIIPPEGMKWVDLLSKGTHWITYSSVRPHKVYGVSVEKDHDYDVTLFDDAVLVRSLKRVDVKNLVLVEKPIEGLECVKWNCDSGLYEICDDVTEDRVPFDLRIKDVVQAETGKVFKCKELRENGVCFLPGGQSYTIPGMGRGQVRPLQTIHTRVADYVVLPSYPGNKFLFPRAGDIEMMCSTISLFSPEWVSMAQQVNGLETDAPLVSTDEVSQRILAAVTSKEIIGEDSIALSVPVISDRTSYSVSFLYRFLAVTPGYVVWKIEGGEIQFTHESVMRVKLEGLPNSRTADGKTWVEILRGNGALKETFKLLNRGLRPLVRFLHWNYCMVNQVDRGSFVELIIRRPKK